MRKEQVGGKKERGVAENDLLGTCDDILLGGYGLPEGNIILRDLLVRGYG